MGSGQTERTLEPLHADTITIHCDIIAHSL